MNLPITMEKPKSLIHVIKILSCSLQSCKNYNSSSFQFSEIINDNKHSVSVNLLFEISSTDHLLRYRRRPDFN